MSEAYTSSSGRIRRERSAPDQIEPDSSSQIHVGEGEAKRGEMTALRESTMRRQRRGRSTAQVLVDLMGTIKTEAKGWSRGMTEQGEYSVPG